MKRYVMALVFVLGGFASAALAQDRLERDPGYVDFQSIEKWFDAEPTLEVNIKGALLKMVSEASRHEDPDLAQLLRKLKAIQVRGFALTPGGYGNVERNTALLGQRLEREGWDSVVRVREREERVDMFIKMNGDAIAGLVVMVVEPGEDETVFVNIVGEINPEEIGRIGRRFDIGALDDPVVRRRN